MIVTLGRALNLLNAGFSVITIGSGKQPNFSWKRNQKTPLSKEQLQKNTQYSGGKKTRNGKEIEGSVGFGIVTGYNNLECIDIDTKVYPSVSEGKKFFDEFVNFISDYIDDFEKRFVIAKTVNSGYHIIYRCEKVGGNQKLASLKGDNRALIETRGIGGYIYVYDNFVGNLQYEDVQEISIEERDILIGLCKYFDYKEEPVKEEIKVNSFESGLTPWQDYDNRNSAIDLLQDEFNILNPLSDRTPLRKKGSKDHLHGYVYRDTGLCYIFSTATIYPPETALSPFKIYAYKYHAGNFSTAASQLYKEGYGDRKVSKIAVERPEILEEEIIFPIDVFPENIQNYMIQNQETLNHSIDYMGSSFLWLLALIVGNSCKMEVKTGWKESANIWIGLIGKAGLGKTPSISAVTFPIDKKNAFEIKHYQKEYRKYKEYEKLTSKDKKDHEEILEPIRKQFIVNDVTVEALADLHQDNTMGIAAFKDELNGWIKDMNKYKPGSDLEFWLSCWSNKEAILTRKTAKSSFIESPLIPVLGGIQPGIFTQISVEENKDNGFLDRLLVSFPDKEIEYYNDKSIDQSVYDWYEGYINQFYSDIRNHILQINEFGDIDPRIIRFDETGEKEWIRVFNKITKMQNSDKENEYVKSMLSKQKSYIPRFCLLLNCLWAHDSEKDFHFVDANIVKKAEKLSDYFIIMSQKIKINTLQNNEIKELIDSLKGNRIDVIVKKVFEAIPDANKKEVAEILNISRQTIYNYLKV